MDKLTAALTYASWGWHVLPVLPDSKMPASAHGVNDATTDPVRIRDWWERNPGLNVGIAAGAKSGIIVIDIDPRNGGAESWEEWINAHDAECLMGEVAMQLTAGGGQHYICEYTDQLRSCKMAEGIDLLADGRYFLAYPSEINGRTYDWEASSSPFDGSPPMTLPDEWVEAIHGRNKKAEPAKVDAEIIEGSRNAGLTALAGAMRNYGMTAAEIHAALSVANETRCSPPLPSSEVAQIARSVARYEPESDIASSAALGDESARALLEAYEPKRDGYYLIRASNVLQQPAPIPWLIKRWLPANATAMLYGESGIGKTFVAVDMACHIATGSEWMGNKTRGGVVVYLAGEGNWGLRQRVAAWAHHHQRYDLDNLLISNRPIDLDSPEAPGEILRAIIEMSPIEDVRLVVVDTMNRHMSGDENSAKDVRNLLNAAGVIQSAAGAAVMFVHHTGHGEGSKGRARGSSAIKASMDTSIIVTGEDGNLKVRCDKMKDAKEPGDAWMRFESVDLGWVDEDGEPEASAAVVVPSNKPQGGDEPTPGRKLRTELENVGIAAFKEAAGTRGTITPEGEFGGVHVDHWRQCFYSARGGGATDSNRKAFLRIKASLIERGDLCEINEMVFCADFGANFEHSIFVKKLQIHPTGT